MSCKTLLTGQQRVDRMFQRLDHDRVPRHDYYWPETLTRWQTEGLVGDFETALQTLDSDFREVGGSWPVPFYKQEKVVEEDETTRLILDEWGATVRYWKGRSGTPEHVKFGCDTRDAWLNIFKPTLEQLMPAIEPELSLQRYHKGRQNQQWCYLTTMEGFEATRRMMGDEISLIAMAEDPDWVIDFSRTYTDTAIRGLEALLATGIKPDGLWLYGDMAYNHSTVCSPDMYRQLIWPDHKRFADWAHQRGMRLIYHTDGNVNSVIDLYLQAGFDCLQPLEAKAGMDLADVVPLYGDRLAFCGNIDMAVVGQNDPHTLEQEMRRKLTAGKQSRGYIYHSDHSVPPTVSWQTYQRLIDCLNRFGHYE
jgi:uroporphyrinogen decarboxylase